MKTIPVILFGAGGVGATLIRQIVASREHTAARNDCRFEMVAVVDSRSFAWATQGLSDDQLLAILARKAQGRPVAPESGGAPGAGALDMAVQAGLRGGILVDVTAENGLEPLLDRALEEGFGLALANKKAFAAPWSSAQRYFNRALVRHESTVGGGQPVIATLRTLVDTGDTVSVIGGQLSGTLGYICSQLDRQIPFSRAVAEAKSLGYTEPDPREDLGGLDVMRKVLILGRLAGWPLETEDIAVEALFPPELAALTVDNFMLALPELDEEMAHRVRAAAQEGQVLRYVAEVTGQGGAVGLKGVPARSPLAGLKYISFTTRIYDDEPLLIGGKGAGVEMTAAGVLGDMIALAREAL